MNRMSLIAAIGILLLGCSFAPVKSSSELVTEETRLNQGQMLPISAKVLLGGEQIELEVAQTSQQQAMGLMYRESLSPSRGMLFPFKMPRYTRFWMQNVVIPLDMVFLLDGEIKAIYAEVPPCTTSPCPTYGPQTLIDSVIELRGGRAAELGLKVGDRAEIQFLNAP